MSEKLQRRVRFVECRLDNKHGSVHAQVVLADVEGKTFTGVGQGEREIDADLWFSADATVDALRQILELAPDQLKLREVVAFQIGDHPAVAVEVGTYLGGQKRRLHGLCQAEADRARAAALAVLGATNRFFVGS